MKYFVILLTLMLTGCGQYVADTKLLSEKMAKCEAMEMATILEFSDNNDGRVKLSAWRNGNETRGY